MTRVSVVIPTHGRPELVTRALRSALMQTLSPVEVVVVVDGEDDMTTRSLQQSGDPRLRVVVVPQRQGAAACRNIGVQAARGDWIALLDDDDEWRLDKLERQAAIARGSEYLQPIVLCRVRALLTEPHEERVWPLRDLKPGERMADYLLRRGKFSRGETLVQTSMILAPRALFLAVPFDPELPRHQEWDWIIRATECDGTGVVFDTEPLVTWHFHNATPRISDGKNWRSSVAWAESMRQRLGARTYASFLLTFVAITARDNRDFRSVPTLLFLAFRRGRPTLRDLAIFLSLWVVPKRKTRQLLRPRVPRRRRESDGGSW